MIPNPASEALLFAWRQTIHGVATGSVPRAAVSFLKVRAVRIAPIVRDQTAELIHRNEL
jgi:hypothetical protein